MMAVKASISILLLSAFLTVGNAAVDFSSFLAKLDLPIPAKLSLPTRIPGPLNNSTSTSDIMITLLNRTCHDLVNSQVSSVTEHKAGHVIEGHKACAAAALTPMLLAIRNSEAQCNAAGIPTTVSSFSVSPTISIKNCPDSIRTLLEQALDGIASVRTEPMFKLPSVLPAMPALPSLPSALSTLATSLSGLPPGLPTSSSVTYTKNCAPLYTGNSSTWGIQTIGARGQGFDGTGVVVGHIDTGVNAAHCALQNHRLNSYWKDATNPIALFSFGPYDDVGHGTHTLGTAVGQKGIGVAPGAQWISCRACTNAGCQLSALYTCAQWMLCPTSNTSNCMPPNVTTNSWTDNTITDTSFQSYVQAWVAAGIIPVFAAGNDGSNTTCSTVSPPASQNNTIAVGSSGNSDAVSMFSSVGPSSLNSSLIKPDLVAPGDTILSAHYRNNNGYWNMTGTSMAAPHVAGTVALLLQKHPNMPFEEVRDALRNGAKDLGSRGQTCTTLDNVVPNNVFGWGRLQVPQSMNLV